MFNFFTFFFLFSIFAGVIVYSLGILELFPTLAQYMMVEEDVEEEGNEHLDDIVRYQLQRLYMNKNVVEDSIAIQNDTGQPPSPNSSSLDSEYFTDALPTGNVVAEVVGIRTPASNEHAGYSRSRYYPQPQYQFSPPPTNYFSPPTPFCAPQVYTPPVPVQPAPVLPSRISLLSDFFINLNTSIANQTFIPAFPTIDFSPLVESVRQCRAALEAFIVQEYRRCPGTQNKDHSTGDIVMEDKSRNVDNTNVHENENVAYLNPRLQAAIQHQVALEQKVDALIDLQRQVQATYQEATYQSLMTWAQTLLGEVQEAVNEAERRRSEYAPQYDSCLRFWYQTIPEIEKRNHLTSFTTSQDTPPPPAGPATSSSAPQPQPPSAPEEAVESQESFLDAMFAPGVRRRGSNGGDALHYPAAQSRGKVNGQSEQNESTSGDASLRACRDRTTASPSSTLLSGAPTSSSTSGPTSTSSGDVRFGFMATADGGVERRVAPGGETVVKGSEADIQFRVKWERRLDAKLQERIRRLRKEKEREQGDLNNIAAAASTPQTRKRRREDVDDDADRDISNSKPAKSRKHKRLRFKESASLTEIRVFKNRSKPGEYVGSESVPSTSQLPPHDAARSKHELRMQRREERRKEKEKKKISSDARRMCRSVMTVPTRRTSSDNIMSL